MLQQENCTSGYKDEDGSLFSVFTQTDHWLFQGRDQTNSEHGPYNLEKLKLALKPADETGATTA